METIIDSELYEFVQRLKPEAIRLFHGADTVSPDIVYSVTARKSAPVRGRASLETFTIAEPLPRGYLPAGGSVCLLLKTQDRFYVYTLAGSATGARLAQCAMIGFEYIEKVCLLTREWGK